MANNRYLAEYQKNAVNTASPVGLVVLLYDHAIASLEAGRHAMGAKEYEAQNRALQKAQKIVVELINCLDLERGGEIATNLLSIYTYVVNQIVEANVRELPDNLERCVQILADLRKSWIAVEAKVRNHEIEDVA